MKSTATIKNILILLAVGLGIFFVVHKDKSAPIVIDEQTLPVSVAESVSQNEGKTTINDVFETLKKEGYCNPQADSYCDRVASNTIFNSDDLKLGYTPFFNVEKNIARIYLNEPNTYEIYDSIDVKDPYVACDLKDAKKWDFVIVSHTGDLPDTFKIIKAYTIDYGFKKFIEIDPKNINCYPTEGD